MNVMNVVTLFTSFATKINIDCTYIIVRNSSPAPWSLHDKHDRNFPCMQISMFLLKLRTGAESW